jgi:hypothetical protein
MTQITPAAAGYRITWRTLLAAILLGFVVVTPFEPNAKKKVELYTAEVTMSGATSGFIQLFYDIGAGFSEIDSVRVVVEPSDKPTVYRFPIPSATYRLLRLDPIDHEETVVFSSFRILDSSGKVVRTFSPEQFSPYNQVASLQRDGDALRMVPTAGAGDPVLIVNLDQPFTLSSPRNYAWSSHLRDALIVAAVLLVAMWAWPRIDVFRKAGFLLSGWKSAYPARMIAAGGCFAAILSVYPVVFLGKSFVSPNYGTCLLYDQMPTLPGYRDTTLHEVGASDVGAIMWQHVPYSMLQRDALIRDRELPLWNRYNSSGNALLGQGQSSFGDPLHFIPILMNGHALAWDLKYLLAKCLFACGLGLLVWSGTRHFAASLLVAVCTPFIGFFIFRVNHPAFFSLCYSPWIVYAWMRIIDANTWRKLVGWTTLLMLANWAELTSGTAKESTMLLFGMNWTGCIILFCSSQPLRTKLVRLCTGVAAGAIFVITASPLWLTFLQNLAKSYTSYDAARVYQLQPGLLLTMFDEIFIRAFMEKQKVINGSLNFLLFFGVCYALVRGRALWSEAVFRGLLLSTLLPLFLVFGVIPPQWITKVPLMGNIAHLDNTFICVLIVQLSVIAGYGFRELFSRIGSSEAKADLAWAACLMLGVVALYLGTTQAIQRTSRTFLHWGQAIHSQDFVYVYLVCMLAGIAIFISAIWHLTRRNRASLGARILVMLGILLVVWRHGWHVGDGFEDYVVHPTARAKFHAKSKALEPVLGDNSAPFRVAGFQGNMFPGWTSVYGLEGICGPDALMNPFYRELTQAAGVERTWDWRFVLEAANLHSQRPIYDFLGVKYYFDRRGDQGAMAKVLTPVIMADLEVYRSESAWPRAFFSPRILPYSDVQEIANWVKSGAAPFAAMSRKDIDDAALRPLLSNDSRAQPISPARGFKLTTNSTTFVVDATSAGLAVLHETYVPRDFKATLNGKDVEVLRANHAFKAVHIPNAGTHVITFTYWPERLTLAIVASICAILIWAGLCFLAPRLPLSWLDTRMPA